jgi:hypothetical protein
VNREQLLLARKIATIVPIVWKKGSVLRSRSFETTVSFYLLTVDMCSGRPKSLIVNARAWLDSA